MGGGSDLQQGLQHEGALMHPRMRHDQSRAIEAGVAVKQEVQIERPWSVREAARAAMAVLDRLQLAEQLLGAELGFERRDGVDEVRLPGVPERRRAVERGAAGDARARQSFKFVERAADLRLRLLEVRSD